MNFRRNNIDLTSVSRRASIRCPKKRSSDPYKNPRKFVSLCCKPVSEYELLFSFLWAKAFGKGKLLWHPIQKKTDFWILAIWTLSFITNELFSVNRQIGPIFWLFGNAWILKMVCLCQDLKWPAFDGLVGSRRVLTVYRSIFSITYSLFQFH